MRKPEPRRRFPQSCTHQARGLGKHHKCNGSRGGYVNQRIDQFRQRNLAGTAGNRIESRHRGEVAFARKGVEGFDSRNQPALFNNIIR